MLGALIALAGRFPLHLSPKSHITVDTAAVLAAVLLLDPALAITTCALAVAADQALQRAPRIQAAFNTAAMGLQTAASALVYHALSSGSDPSLTAIAVAGATLYLANVLINEGIISVHLWRRPFTDWWRTYGEDVQYQACLLPLGALAALVAEQQPLGLLLIVPPMAVLYRSLLSGYHLRVQTRETVMELADIVDMRDHYTFEHSKRVGVNARLLAEELGLDEDTVDAIFIAARVHDVGKIGISSHVLLKPGSLSDAEWKEMASHPQVGARLAGRLPEFRAGLEIIISHHERYDGAGYPRGLKGAAIPLGGRIVAVVDAFDAMTSSRAYRAAMPVEEAARRIAEGSGSQFDPAIAQAFLRILDRAEPGRAGGAIQVETLKDTDLAA
jgi:HD-GYP domain-containing protein (c-di-GMP phosphodiesterase class II)